MPISDVRLTPEILDELRCICEDMEGTVVDCEQTHLVALLDAYYALANELKAVMKQLDEEMRSHHRTMDVLQIQVPAYEQRCQELERQLAEAQQRIAAVTAALEECHRFLVHFGRGSAGMMDYDEMMEAARNQAKQAEAALAAGGRP